LPLDDESKASLGRTWVTNGAGLLTVDSPRMLFTLLDTFERVGLHEAVSEYLGERPVMSANKCTLRRVPVETNAGWHQDGAFLGRGIRALNIWLALSDCGVDAPSLDIVPRRFDDIVATGTHGSYFDWAVGPGLIEELARETPVARPVFGPGDVLMFDDMLLHRTATDATMTRPRYAIETWFFAASHYPEGHVPVVW
jgi:ectoine hydroxylase-related dioxygenase (phytanoyl-CoA dioxygenase family)